LEESRPLVSIIVRTKDRPKLLKRALQSINEQIYRPIEVVLVNDGGCDLDREELRGILGDVSLNYRKLEENMGRAQAGNVGIENAKGEYVGFLDDDDEFYPDHVETLVSLLEQGDNKIVYSDALFVYKDYDADSGELKEVRRELAFSQDFDNDKLVFENYIPFMCLMFDKNALVDSGGFDANFDLYEDWDLLIRLGDKYPFQHIRKATASYNQWNMELQISQRNRDQDFLKQSYLKVLSKHIGEITPDRIHAHVADYSAKQYLIKDLQRDIAEYRNRDILIGNLEATIKERESLIRNLEDVIKQKEVIAKENDARIKTLEISAREKDEQITIMGDALTGKEAYIQMIHSGRGWKLLTKYFKLRDSLLPVGSRRRLFVKLFLKMLTSPKEVFVNLKKSNFQKFIYYLKRSDAATLGKKIEQKLSYEAPDRKTSQKEIAEQNLQGKPWSKDYFSFLFEMNTRKGEGYVPLSYPSIPETDIKLIAFYLPQFHPIPENDEWWGKGFTEWTNVSRAVPQFVGHYQPRLPGELGFYDLRIPEVQGRQVELAGQYGIHGFCFHFYWFNGRTLLEGPLKQFVDNFDFPFCLNWANENWTRRWDGKEREKLIDQKHSPADDIEFITYISKYLKNKNYIRIKSKPLLIVYKPTLLPNPKATAARWREWCVANGIGEIYLALTHSFEHVDPESIGFDAAIEFPPNTFPLKEIAGQFRIINPHYKGVILDYNDAVELSTKYPRPPYRKFRGICPSWDNEARMPGRGTVLENSSPANFKQWLKILCRFTDESFDPEEKIIFLNAWNEWAEGAYLEPDRRYGYAYLQAVANALIEYRSGKKRKQIIYVCHDAHFHGAQLLSLHIVRILKLKFYYDVHFILKSGGELEPEYAKYGEVYNLERDYKTPKEKTALIEYLFNLGVRDAICNTVVSGDLAEPLHEKGLKTVTLVHELPNIIREKGVENNARLLATYSDKVVFPSDFVKEKFQAVAKVEVAKTAIVPQGLFKQNKYRERKAEARRALRESLSLPESAQIVLGVGFGDRRKGVDLFVEVAKIVTQEKGDVYFVWVGNLHIGLEKAVRLGSDSNKHIIFQSTREDISVFYAGADVFLLTSREDQFPIVVLDAMHVGLPVIGFNDAGGFRDIVTESTGGLVPYLDTNAMAKEVLLLLNDPQKIKVVGSNASKLIEENFNFTDYIYRLLALLGHDYKKVSVILPNYNYEKYLEARLHSILNQTYPVYEIIILDDASTDRSVRIAEKYLDEGLNVRLLKNATNSGSVFKQWSKGLQVSQGDYIWIAEADDLCENKFLEELMACFAKDNEVVMAYCQSRQIDERGRVLADNYRGYTDDVDKYKWLDDYIIEGTREISDTLVVKNTIPNVSAVVFRKCDISSITDELFTFKIAGDWFFYVWLLKRGKIAYVSQSLNLHRRHDRGVTKSEDKDLHYSEVVKMQEYVMKNFDVAAEAREKAHSYREYVTKFLVLH
jgi:glycosyltransferase involved in cell wall biosynthesis